MLGFLCGAIFAMSNGVLILVIKLVVNVVFNGDAAGSVAVILQKAPSFARPMIEQLIAWLPALSTPKSTMGLVLVISTVPAVMLVRNVFGYLNAYLMGWAALRAVADLRTALFGHLQSLSLAFFSQARTGDLISRINSDTHVLQGIIRESVSSMVRDPITVVVLMSISFWQQPSLTLVSIIVLPACLVPITIYGRKARKSARKMQTHMAEWTSLMHEAFTGNRIIKAYNLEATVLDQFRATTRSYVNQVMRVVRANEIPGQFTEFLASVGISLVFLYVIFFTDRSQASAGDFVGFVLSIVIMYQPIKALTRLHNQINQAAASSQRVFELLDTVNDVVDPPSPVPLKAVQADIHFENVQFKYGAKPVLRGINLTVKAGQMVALVGASGSGKTTLANLLLRFYDPQGGVVRIGSTDIRQVRLKDLRQQIALVAQETILFNESIRQNIAVGRPGASDSEIEAAARHAHAHEFIMERPENYATVVGEKGFSLSGGQKQRIAIARALLRNAPILVLDEATSALDSESERVVQAGLEELMQGRTTICIAHRLSTVQKADVIVVLEEGSIAEQGTHDSLMQAQGLYWKLNQLQ
jgi:ATP-binding cassette, subfamily B, bacterial MsbA